MVNTGLSIETAPRQYQEGELFLSSEKDIIIGKSVSTEVGNSGTFYLSNNMYNEKVKCIGFHEYAHLIRFLIHQPEIGALRQGLAMF